MADDDGWQMMYIGLKSDVAKVDARVDLLARNLESLSTAVLAALQGVTDRLDNHSAVLDDVVARLTRIEERGA